MKLFTMFLKFGSFIGSYLSSIKTVLVIAAILGSLGFGVWKQYQINRLEKALAEAQRDLSKQKELISGYKAELAEAGLNQQLAIATARAAAQAEIRENQKQIDRLRDLLGQKPVTITEEKIVYDCPELTEIDALINQELGL